MERRRVEPPASSRPPHVGWLSSDSAFHHLVCPRVVPGTQDPLLAAQPLLPLCSFAQFVQQLPEERRGVLGLPDSVMTVLNNPLAVQSEDGAVRASDVAAALSSDSPLLLPLPLHNATLWIQPPAITAGQDGATPDPFRLTVYSAQASLSQWSLSLLDSTALLTLPAMVAFLSRPFSFAAFLTLLSSLLS
jgi:hypothetical protein